MPVDFKLVGKRVREVRTQQGLSQAELAELANVTPQYISHVETAKKKASLQALVDIANGLGITLDELLSGNLMSNPVEYLSDIDVVLEDCNRFEKRVIFELICATKSILRDNLTLLIDEVSERDNLF
ncbi:MAG: helix-turn-helix transcriptional regulator [Parabacteroides sp.]|nr:helix-turn-helix transcriptional regulator [Parabacteroides sp.]